MSQSPEVLLDMMEIDSLTSILETVGGDVPNPECAVAQDQDQLGHGQTPLKGLGIELSLKAIHAPACGDVAALGDDPGGRSWRCRPSAIDRCLGPLFAEPGFCPSCRAREYSTHRFQ